MNLETRITHNPLQCGGKSCIRNMRICVSDILKMLGEGISRKEILQDFPDLEQQDISGLSVVCRPPGKFGTLGGMIYWIDAAVEIADLEVAKIA